MALGDLMASRFAQSSVSVGSNHLDHHVPSSSNEDGDFGTSNLSYLPQNVVLCELRHEAFEACVPCGPPENGLVSKCRHKDRGCDASVLLDDHCDLYGEEDGISQPELREGI